MVSQQPSNALLWAQTWPAPAKLNLMLRVMGRRPDGYHLLQTVFQFVDWCDWITFYPVDDSRVSLASPLPGLAEEDDLTVKAAKLLQNATGCRQGVKIKVEKNLPMGGGIGGGSSDAATTLLVLNVLWGLNLTTKKLMELGLALGADVPIFVYGKSAWAEGVGEKIQGVELPEPWAIIIKPQCDVSTKEIFSRPELTRDSKPITIEDFVFGNYQNDCLAVVSTLYPPIKKALDDLSRFSKPRLTGTGACVFALFCSETDAKNAYSVIRKQWDAFLVKTQNKSPLHSKFVGLAIL